MFFIAYFTSEGECLIGCIHISGDTLDSKGGLEKSLFGAYKKPCQAPKAAEDHQSGNLISTAQCVTLTHLLRLAHTHMVVHFQDIHILYGGVGRKGEMGSDLTEKQR